MSSTKTNEDHPYTLDIFQRVPKVESGFKMGPTDQTEHCSEEFSNTFNIFQEKVNKESNSKMNPTNTMEDQPYTTRKILARFSHFEHFSCSFLLGFLFVSSYGSILLDSY